MTFGEHVFLYCERGTNAALWAEPINTISNAGFFLAALMAWQLLLWRPREERSADHYLLIALTFLIGFGSLAFHVYADEGTSLADIVPIGLFMLVYLGFALNRFLGVPPGWTVLLAIGFTVLVGAAMHVQCWDGGIGFAGSAVPEAKPCLNGSIGYLPALGALIVIGMLLAERHHRAGPYVVWAAAIFAISILFRSVDLSFCYQVVIKGRQVGTHFIWHLLNALVLFLLLRASLEAGPVAAVSAEAEEKPAKAPEPMKAPVEAMPVKDEIKESPEAASAGQEAALEVAEAPKDEIPETKDEPEPEAKGEEPEADHGDAAKASDENKGKPTAKKSRSKKKPSFPA
jgi:hypothetical protein